jgi:hypothetical protein
MGRILERGGLNLRVKRKVREMSGKIARDGWNIGEMGG